MSTELKLAKLSGAGGVAAPGRDDVQLMEVVRACLQFQAAHLVETNSHTDITDNSGGSGTVTKALTVPSAAADGSGGTNGDASDFDAALGTVNDACAVLMDAADDLADLLGIAGTRGEGNGTIAVADTVAAITTDIGAVSTSDAIEFEDYVTEVTICIKNLQTVVRVVNKLANAVGVAELADVMNATMAGTRTNWTTDSLTNKGTVGADSDNGTTSVLETVAETFLSDAADCVAGICAKLSAIIGVTASTDAPVYVAGLTD